MSRDLVTVIEARKDTLAKVLPPSVSINRFMAAAKTALYSTPGLDRCEPQSIVLSLMKCATDALVPDGRDAALIVFNQRTSNGQWRKVAQYVPMVGGLLKKMRRSGQILGVEPRAVYENDDFDIRFGTEPRVDHKPALKDKGELVGSYAVFTFVNGSRYVEWMDNNDLDAIMRRSKSVDKQTGEVTGPWKTDYAEMCKKTVLKRAMKVLPTEPVSDDDDTEEEVWNQEDYWPPKDVDGFQNPPGKDEDQEAEAAEEEEKYRRIKEGAEA